MAYSVLSDKEKRAEYDNQLRYGAGTENTTYQYNDFNPFDIFSSFFKFFGVNPEDVGQEDEYEYDFSDDEDIFGSDFFTTGSFDFGSMGMNEHSNKRKARKVDGQVFTMSEVRTYPLDHIYKGGYDTFKYKYTIECENCKGKGYCGKPKGYCKSCCRIDRRTGHVKIIKRKCDGCHGFHVDFKGINICPKCNGHRIVRKVMKTPFHIPRGWSEKKPLILHNAYIDENGKQGNVGIYVRCDDSRCCFKRKGDDLLYNMQISFVESLCGFTKEIELLDKRVVTIYSPAGDVIKNGSQRRVKQGGMVVENKNTTGDLIITFHVDYPDYIPFNQASAIASAFNYHYELKGGEVELRK